MKINKSLFTILALSLSISAISPNYAQAVSVFENGTPQYDSTHPYNISDSLKNLDRAESSISKMPNSLRWKSIPKDLLRVYLWHKDSFHDSDTIKLSNIWINLADKVEDKDIIQYAKLSKVFANFIRQNFKEAEKVYSTIKFDKYDKDDLFTYDLIETLLGEEKETKANFQGNNNLSFTYNIRVIKLEDAKNLVDKYPKSDIARYIYAITLQKTAESTSQADQSIIDYRDAIDELDQALLISPSNSLYELKKAQLTYNPSNPENSDDAFENIYKKSYKDSYIGESIATTYARYGRFDKALEYIESAIKQDDSRVSLYKKLNSLYAYSNNFNDLIPIYEKALEKYPNKIELYYDLADLYVKTKADPSKNVSLFETAVTKNPKSDALALYLADSYYNSGNLEQAVSGYQKVIEINENNVDAYGKLISLLWDKGDNENVLKTSNQALKENPNFVMAYLWIASSQLRQNKIDDAVNTIKKAIKVKPDFVLAYNSLGVAYKAQKKYDLAIEGFKKAVQLNPNYPESLLNIGDTYALKGDYSSSEKAYNDILATDPYNENVYFALGNLYTESKNYDKSVKSFEKAILLNPKSLDSRNNLGNVYLKQNKLDNAIDEFEKVLKIDPKYATAYYNIACIYSLKMDQNYSLRFLEEALSLDPTLKDVAKKDPDFDNMKNDNRFKELIN